MLWRALGVLLLGTLAGCGQDGPRKHRLSGAVTFEGRPVEDGDIRFVPVERADWGPDGAVISNGRYTVEVKEGKVRVEITGNRPITDPDILKKAGPGPPPREDFIPAQHNSASTTVLDVTVSRSDLDFHLR